MAGAERRKCKCCHKLFRPDPRKRQSPAILRGAELSRGRQSRQPGSLARRSREPRLFPRLGEYRPGEGVAIAQSRLLAQAAARRRCVTRTVDSMSKTGDFAHSALQEIILAQPAVLIGLIAISRGHRYKKKRYSVPPTVCYGWAKTFSLPHGSGCP